MPDAFAPRSKAACIELQEGLRRSTSIPSLEMGTNYCARDRILGSIIIDGTIAPGMRVIDALAPD